MSDEFRKGWVITPLETLAAKTKYPIGDGDHGQIKPASYTDKGIPYIRVADMGWGKFEPNGLVYISDSVHKQNPKSELRPGDVLIAKTGATIGKCCIVPESIPKANTTSSVGKVTINHEITSPEWILYYFLSREFKDQMWAVSEKTAQPGFNIGDLKQFLIPLAPLDEQWRIVTKLKKLLGKVDASQKRLTKIPIILKRFRQSVLAAACSGRLTADWREDDQYQNDFPVTWTICKLSDISTLITKGASPKWQGVNYAENGVLFVTSENVGLGKMLLDTKKFVESKINEIQPRSVLRNGDVLTNIVGASIGRSAIFDRDDVANINQAVALIRLTSAVNRKYILHVLNSPAIVEHMESEKVDVARANLTLKDVGDYPIPLPPLTEQEEVVRRVEAFFALADQIEARFAKAKTRVDQLTQSLLAKAFRGELVSQNPNDEPAPALLERIKVERREGETEAKGGGKKRLNVNRKGKGL